MNNQKIKVVLISGFVFAVSIALIEFLLYNFCTNNIMCLGLIIIPIFPGVLINLEGNLSVAVSFIVWFLLGSLMGFLVYKMKVKKS